MIVILLLDNSYVELSFAQTDTGLTQDEAPSGLTYLVDTPSSVLRVFVEKAGVLAAMGHNHVITFHDISGQIITSESVQLSNATLQILLGDSIVDDEQERKRAGEGFTSVPGESARAGTRSNMNGPRVLDITRYPLVNADISFPDENPTTELYEISLEFRDSIINLKLPAQVTISENIIEVESNFTLNHSQLGIRPFTAAGGLLKVADEIRFELYVQALRQ